ncbi:HD domain-containing protein [Comamonas testosteroni]|uniref:HD domain-containing protein n=1 Tax=Comamonas testosteroni TaxID=285 RepID=A0A373F5P3_COMTE|nr:HD domain-containing phosphohydrolase [Comamonas testosteroni]RGE39484.1 HD domain-containing protein [Comamonas testosteroni]
MTEKKQRSVQEEGHFLRAVTDMAEHVPVITGDAIYTDKGIKLVDKGTRVDQRLYERLVSHKLRDPIDESLVADDLVDVEALLALAATQCESVPLLHRMAEQLGGAARLMAPLKSLLLPRSIAFKLTVMREQRTELFAHSLQMALVSIYLAFKNGWNERECVSLATAALLHDVGMLYMDPAWTDPEHRLSVTQRKHLVAHSVTAMLVVRDAKVYSQAVELAVLEHHERMDGSGYPRGVQGAAISPMGQVLLLAEVVSAFFEKFSELPGQRLSLMLRMNHKSYPGDLVHHILPLLYEEMQPGMPLEPLQAEVSHNTAALDAALRLWASLRHDFPAQWQQQPDAQAAVFVEQSLQLLQKQLAEAGSHPSQQLDVLSYLRDDPQGMSELALVNREALWALQSIINECQRRWPAPPTSTPALAPVKVSLLEAAVARWCDACGRIELSAPQG